MIVVQTFTKDAGEGFENLTTAVTFESLGRRLKLYFSDLKKVRGKILAGGIISIPYLTLQRDRRIVSRAFKNERRKKTNWLVK